MDEYPHYYYEESAGVTLASTAGTTITADTSADTKGGWSPLIASTADYTGLMVINISEGSSANDTSYLIDIGIGGSGSEVVIIPNLGFNSNLAAGATARKVVIPVSIPAGTRIAARCQASIASETVDVHINLYCPNFAVQEIANEITAYGADTANSLGTSIDPLGTAHTKGGWVELTSSTSQFHNGLLIYIGINGNINQVEANWLVDIGIGAASSEVVIIGNEYFDTDAFEASSDCYIYIPMQIPDNTRIAAQCQCSITDATDRLIDVIVYGIS